MPLRPHRRRCGVGDLLERQAPRTLLRRQVLTGNPRPLGDQDSVGCNAKRCMVVEAPPPAALVMTEPKFLFEFQIITLDPPAHLGEMHQAIEGDVLGQGRQPVLRRCDLLKGPFDQVPLLAAGLSPIVVAVRRTYAHAGKQWCQ